MSILQWIQFSFGIFSAILQALNAAKASGIPPAVAAPILIANAHAVPGMTDEHKTIITAVGETALKLVEAA